MSSPIYRSTAAAIAFVGMTATTPTLAQAQDAARTLADNEAIFIDGQTLTVTPGRSKDDVVPHLRNLNAHALGAGAIVFRSGDRLYVIDGMPTGAAMAMYDPGIDRQRSYGGLYDADYANYRLKKIFGAVWGPTSKN